MRGNNDDAEGFVTEGDGAERDWHKWRMEQHCSFFVWGQTLGCSPEAPYFTSSRSSTQPREAVITAEPRAPRGFDEAEAHFLNAANNPLYDSPEIALTNAGSCLFEDKPKVGESYYKRALDKNPLFSYALIKMADVSYNKNEYKSAYQYFKRYQENAKHTAKSLWIGIRIFKELNLTDDMSSYALLLRNQYSDTPEAKKLNELQF